MLKPTNEWIIFLVQSEETTPFFVLFSPVLATPYKKFNHMSFPDMFYVVKYKVKIPWACVYHTHRLWLNSAKMRTGFRTHCFQNSTSFFTTGAKSSDAAVCVHNLSKQIHSSTLTLNVELCCISSPCSGSYHKADCKLMSYLVVKMLSLHGQ